MSNQPSIDVQRRRKGGEPTGRAQAPSRSGGFGPLGGGGAVKTGGAVGGCATVIIMVCAVIYYLVTGGGGGDTGTTTGQTLVTESSQTSIDRATNTPRPTKAPVAGQRGQKWLVMMYEDADDQILEQDMMMDVNEAERAGSTGDVTILAQVDRFQGAYRGDGNWTSTRRYLVTQDDDLNNVHSQLLADLGEANMADGATLVDFVTWAVSSYPADHYVLILSDHGMGWPGGWSDPDPGGSDPGRAPLIGALNGDFLYLSEIDQALGQIRQQTGIDKFDLIGMDACLMSQLEVYAALQPHAHYAVASEETEPALGWAYAGFLKKLDENPAMGADSLAAEIVSSYIDQDQRIVDDQARQDFLRGGSASADQLARQIGKASTLTAVDLDALPDLMAKFNAFAYQLQSEDQGAIASARNYAQSYTSVFGENEPPSYIDLGHFASLAAKESGDQATASAAQAVIAAERNVVVAEKHGKSKPGSTGIAVYFPNSSMYRSPYTGPQSYNAIASRFVKESLWDDFLAYHYNDRSFQEDAVEAVAPSSGMPSRAPGAGKITVSDVTVSNDTPDQNKPTRLSAVISGKNIGYIYLFIGLYDKQSNSIYVADTDFMESSQTNELNGVYYPAWPDSQSFKINFTWDTSLFAISDGTNSTLALFNPLTYGAAAENAAYVVNGTYTFADTGEQRYAQIHFVNGKLDQILGFEGKDDTGAPAEITPSSGDTFTIRQKWMDLDSNGQVTKVSYEDGDKLTFGDGATFTWETVWAPAGEYVIGYIASDLDGNISEGYTQVRVP